MNNTNARNSYYSEILPASSTNIFKCSDSNTNTNIILQWFHPLSKSNNKYICVGLNVEDFNPTLKLSGNKGFSILLNECEWNEILNYQGVITNNLFSPTASSWYPIEFGNIGLYFEQICNQNVLKIVKNDVYIYLERETVCNLWNLIPLLEKKITLLKNNQFKQYFSVFKNNYTIGEGGVVNKIFELLSAQENSSENICALMELAILHPLILERKINQF